jgi:hydroxyethylthiazole kinase-like uncharacterized protein yjeF
MIALDQIWLDANPLPRVERDTDKNRRGRLLVVGGSLKVPGALLLTGEAGFRAGAGKVQLATPGPISIALGVRIPEAAVHSLEVDASGEICAGETLWELLGECDAAVLGPGTGRDADIATILKSVLRSKERSCALLLDAAVIAGARDFAPELRAWRGPVLMTPHRGEMAALAGCDPDAVNPGLARRIASEFGATIVLKGAKTYVVSPGGEILHYAGGGAGLATGGSGDVLAGVIGGLSARGVDPQLAAAYGVWAHGEAGHKLSAAAEIGFLARELPPLISSLLYPP